MGQPLHKGAATCVWVARAHDGAIVKTMGDAVMATFSTPREGVQALADAGELVVTESAHAALGVSDALSGAAVLKEKASVSLRGIAEPTPVLRYALG